MKPTEKPDMQQTGSNRQSNKVTPGQLLAAIVGVLMLIVTTVSLTNSINVSAQQKRDTELKDHVNGNTEDIVELKEAWATVPIIVDQISRDIAEIKLDVKDLRQ